MPAATGRLESPIWNKFDGGWQTVGDTTKTPRYKSPDLGNVVVMPNGGIVKRKGAYRLMDKSSTSPGKKITMLYNFKQSDGTQRVLVGYDGKVQLLDMSIGDVSELPTPVTGQSTTASYCADVYDDTAYFCNGVDAMHKYTGTTNTTITLTNVAGSQFLTDTFIFKDRKMYAVDAGNRTLMHRSATEGGSVSNVYSFSYSGGSVIENAGTSRIKEGGTPITSLAVLDNLYIHSENNIFKGDYLDIAGSTVFDIKNVGRGVGAINHKSTISIGNALMFFDPQDNAMQQYGQKEQYPNLVVSGVSDAIRNLTGPVFDFTESASVYYERKVLVACKSEKNLGANDLVLLYDLETRSIFPIYGWYVSTWMIYNDELYYGSSTAAQVFKAFTGESNDNAPISWWYASNVECFGKPEGYKDAGYLYVEGTIDPNLAFDVSISYDYGAQSLTKTIDGASTAYVMDNSEVGFLGEEMNGVDPLGGSIAEESERVFQVWIRTNKKKFQNAQVTFRSKNDPNKSGIGRVSIRQFNFVGLKEVSSQPPECRVI